MKKNALILFLFIVYLLSISTVRSEIIKEIEVTGNKRIARESIVVLSKIKINDSYDNNLINESLKSLYDTDFFNDVKISMDKNKILISVSENPIIEKLEFTGIKNKSLLEFIKKNIYLKERFSYNSYHLKKDIDLINNILKSNGYYFSEIKSSFFINNTLNTISLNIDVELGDKAKINNIIFLGNKVYKDKKLKEIIASEEHKFWKFISKNVYINQNLINLDKRLLINYYKNRGYYKVEIKDNFVELNKRKSSFSLTYNIDSGPLFKFKNFSLTLPNDYSKKDFKKIYEIFNENENASYSLELKNEILAEVEKIASNRLYDFIDVSIEEKIINQNELDLNFIVSDSKKFFVERINIKGNNNTYEEVIRNQLLVDEGDPLNNLLFEKSLNDIRSLKIFKKVDHNIVEGSDENLKVIEINIEEQPTGEIAISAGYGNNGVTTGGSLNERNFLGKGININTFFQISEDSLKGELIYTKPNFAYSDNSLFTSIKSINNDFLSLYGYESKELGFSIGTKFEQYKNLFFSPEIDFTNEKLVTNTGASNNIKKQEGTYSDLYFNYSLDYDGRNSSFNPSDGYLLVFSQELPAISENNELSNSLIVTKYKELNKSTEMIGRASFYIKSINTFNGEDVRISKRANIPYNRLRGFERGKVGPIDGNDYIGGNYISSLNLSTNIPGLLSNLEILDFNYFVDIANVWGVDYNENLDNSKIRSSTGIGVNLATPIGPLSFSLSQPISKASTDKTETFRFNLGTTF